MPSGQRDLLLSHFRRAALRHGGLGDAELLGCFIERRDEDAFAALVRRHGPMVLGVCRRVLRNAADAEDAFQATFLVLARKAASLRARELVGNWLYGTAYRTALEARNAAARRQARERAAAVPETWAEPDEGWRELLPLLDREVSRLPEKYRAAVVLCELEGKSRKEAARLLKLPEGTVSSRLAAARKLLARRLARYGLALAGVSLAGLLAAGGASAGVPAALVLSTGRAAALVAAGSAGSGVVSVNVAALMKGVLKTMLLAKLKTAAAVLLGVAALGAGTGGLVYRTQVRAAESPTGSAVVAAKPGGVRADPAQEEARQRARERELAERQARDAAEAEARARAERDRAAQAAEAERKALEQAQREAEAARREAEAARAEALRQRDRAVAEARALAERDRAVQALQQQQGSQAPRSGAADGQLAPDDARRKAQHHAMLEKLEMTRAQLTDELKQLKVQQEALERDMQVKRESLMQRLKDLEMQQAKVESELKARPDDRPRHPSQARPEAAPPGDKLDQILQRLERMERRLDRLERGSRSSRPGDGPAPSPQRF